MPDRKSVRRVIVTTALGALALWSAEVMAHSTGSPGLAQSPTGCSCHNTAPNQNGAVTVTITGPQAVAPGATYAYTISVSGGPGGTTGGVDLHATGGRLIAGTGTAIESGDLVHSDATHRSWPFSWTAPGTQGNYNFYAIGMSSNGTFGADSWNWYGGAVNTPFIISVDSLVDVGDRGPSSLFLYPASPNPSRSWTMLGFTLPQAGPARLEVFDPAGRKVADLLSGELPAGTHNVAWQGRDDRGGLLPSGRYVLRLEASGRALTRSIVLLR